MNADSLTPATASVTDVDWRFLLPHAPRGSFEHLVLLGGSPALERLLLQLGVARRVSRMPVDGDQGDAVIVLAGATESVDGAARHLGANGVLYWEIDRRNRGCLGVTPGHAARRMRRLGLSPTGSYWVKPGFTNRQMYLPLGAVSAFRWYLETLYRSRTPRRLLNGILRALALDRRGLTAVAPCFAVTAVRGPARAPALIERARQEGISIAADALPVLLAHGRAEWNRVVFLLFASDAPHPTAALKVPRLPVFNEQTAWEHHVLDELRAHVGPSLGESLPASTLFRWNELMVSMQTCVAGASVHSRSGPAATGPLEDLRLTADWLAAFHRETAIERVPARQWIAENLINGVCAEYAATFQPTAAETRLFETLSRRLDTVDEATVPIAWQHADFCPPNVYLNRSQVSVIDWETARRGPAVVDLLSFITYWGAAIAGCMTDTQRVEHFEALLCAPALASPFVQAVHAEIADYMRRLNVPRWLLPFLLVYTFLEKALEEPRRRARLEGSGASDRTGNLEAAYVESLARHADSLFGIAASVGEREAGRADVTVAIATIDRPSRLERCVAAMLAGSTLPAEIVIVDQSSDGRTADLVATAAWQRVVSIRYVRQACCGLAASRNAAIAHSSQPIIVFTDDDCVAGHDWLKTIVAGFASAEGPAAVTGQILPFGPEQPDFHAMSTLTRRARTTYAGRSLPWVVGSGANTAVTRQWLERVGGFDERLGAGSPGRSAEDVDLLYRLLRAGATVRYDPDAMVFHERQYGPRRRATSSAYGFGMGAFCALWARRRDPYALWMLAGWCVDRGRALASACAQRRWWRLPEELLMLAGAVRGMAYGVACPERDGIPQYGRAAAGPLATASMELGKIE
jgi:GT2 family glycosyltransferase/aminoglycoside phosphotransferase (APT) family kinase protein